MKKIVLVSLTLATLLPVALLARERTSRVRELTTQQSSDIRNPMGQTGGWVLPTFTAPSDLAAQVTIITRKEAPWTDPSFTSQLRIASGMLLVGVYRLRGSKVCMTQILQAPAQGGYMDSERLDLTQYTTGDAVMFESWPAYDVNLQVWSVSDPTKFFAAAVVKNTDNVIRNQGVTLGNCN